MKIFTVQISDPIEVEHDQEVHEQHLKISNLQTERFII